MMTEWKVVLNDPEYVAGKSSGGSIPSIYLSFVRYSIPIKELDNVLVNLPELRVFMDGDDYLLFGGLLARLPLEKYYKRKYLVFG
ncbi:hypothetical protein EVAR_62290_1 [Eumeta japonica]|uniref:Uncharacterized protein n=1 Tax=Eumeta variegata TaxID=151549 RepID=A0A4C1ZU16_EUMVA|nr:hypothetical protein EVAR_62290_1 [Eumeta japonica]